MYVTRLYGYCFQYTKSHLDTEEMVQDVFVKLWLNRENIQNEITILPFLFTMLKNQLINRYRMRINSPEFEEYVMYVNEEQLSINNTGEVLEYDDLCRLIEKIKHTMPETQRRIYELSSRKQLSNKEIAELLNLSEQTVKNQLSLALKTLRQKLRNY